MDFETKLAAAGETLEKLAAEHGLDLGDFTEQETVDLLTTIMGDKEAASLSDFAAEGPDYGSLDPAVYDQIARRTGAVNAAALGGLGALGGGMLGHAMHGGMGAAGGAALGGLAGGAAGYGLGRLGAAQKRMIDLGRESTKGQGVVGGRLAPDGGPIGNTINRALLGEGAYASPEEIMAAAASKQASFTYGEVMHEVAKVAAANGYDISQASPAELDDAVQKMAALLSNPEYLTKQAALQEKIAEADAMGRVMAHAYVDELGKLASSHEETEEEKKEREKKEEEKKASFYRSVKSAGEMPAALKEHMKKKHEGKEDEEEEEEEKKASFAKAASLRAAELLILNGINPDTGYKFASQQEALDAGATLVLQSKGYI